LGKLTQYFEELTPAKSFHLLKKHVKAFVSGWDNAAELRAKLMDAPDYESFRQELSQAQQTL
jgi:hypothetical protein